MFLLPDVDSITSPSRIFKFGITHSGRFWFSGSSDHFSIKCERVLSRRWDGMRSLLLTLWSRGQEERDLIWEHKEYKSFSSPPCHLEYRGQRVQGEDRTSRPGGHHMASCVHICGYKCLRWEKDGGKQKKTGGSQELGDFGGCWLSFYAQSFCLLSESPLFFSKWSNLHF